jgi:hypothetical protein
MLKMQAGYAALKTKIASDPGGSARKRRAWFGASMFEGDSEYTTVIGRMEDLKQFVDDPAIDTWWKSGRIPGPPPDRITWKENEDWLWYRMLRGDKFGIATDPATLPPVKGGYIAGQPNGYFTARELKMLRDHGIEPIPMYK